MGDAEKPELLLLHALPLDGTMWVAQMQLLPGATHAPTLYGLGETVEDWAAAALKLSKGNRLIVVGCSVGGSCAIEMARLAPDRVVALVLIGTKVAHRPDPDLRESALRTIREKGMTEAWRVYWAPLFSSSADPHAVAAARQVALAQSPEGVSRGVTAFHRRPDRSDFLSKFDRPVFIVTGADDRAPGPRISAKQASAAPAGSLHEVANCGHYVPLEQPEALNAILRSVVTALC
jgi:pimeloyl-[acyl-carrier protein] methyl ester esterase